MSHPNPYDFRSPEEVWLDDLRADHEDNHRMNLDEVYGGKGARKCQWCEEEDEASKET